MTNKIDEENEVEREAARSYLATVEAIRAPDAAACEDSWASPKLQLDHWHKSEEIAMHFNDLLMRFRLQALGGLSVVAAVAGLASKETIQEIKEFLPLLVGFMSVAWGALWLLDHFYYSLLLRGAVDEVLAVEKRLPLIKMSHKIHRRVGGDRARCVADAFYAMVGAVLVAMTLLAWCARTHPPQATTPAASPTSVPP